MATLDVQIESPRLIKTERDPVERHLPTVKIPREGDVRCRHPAQFNVVARAARYFPVWGQAEIKRGIDDGAAYARETPFRDSVRKVQIQGPGNGKISSGRAKVILEKGGC